MEGEKGKIDEAKEDVRSYAYSRMTRHLILRSNKRVFNSRWSAAWEGIKDGTW